MSVQTQSQESTNRRIDDDHSHRRRSAWRQRLVQAERGLACGVRADSVFFVHFFGIALVIAAALVLKVGLFQWIAIAACLTLVLTAEMFNQALKSLAGGEDEEAAPTPPAVKRALAMSTAAVMVACAGSSLVMTLVFWQRLGEILEM